MSDIEEAEKALRAVGQHGRIMSPEHATTEVLLYGILAAQVSQARSLESEPYGPGQDQVVTDAMGDTREEILITAFHQAREFFGPGRELAVAEPWTARLNMNSPHGTHGFYRAVIAVREVPSS